MIRARLESPQRTIKVEPQSAILIADGKVYPACSSASAAFDCWLDFTEWLARPENTPPSARWQALMVATSHGRNAKREDRRAQALTDYSSATTVLELAKEILGAEAYAKLRNGLVDRMMGKPGS